MGWGKKGGVKQGAISSDKKGDYREINHTGTRTRIEGK